MAKHDAAFDCKDQDCLKDGVEDFERGGVKVKLSGTEAWVGRRKEVPQRDSDI